MDTPPCALISDKKNINFNQHESFEISEKDQKFTLIISYNENLILFEIINENTFPKNKYSLLKNLNELKEVNNYFKCFDNLEEVLKALKLSISKKNLSIVDEKKVQKLKCITL